MKTRPRYALITGAANGLGKSLSVECAKRNFNLVLADVDETGMHKLAAFLTANFDVKAMCFATNLATRQGCEQLFEQIHKSGIRISMLINNAGIGGTSYFEQRTIEHLVKQIELNVTAPTLLTRLFIDDLKMTGEKAYVLNVASLAGFFHLPGKQVYGATKAFLLSFSRSLRKEFAAHSVVFSVLCPGGMNTNLQMMLKHRNCSWLSQLSILPPEVVAQVAMDSLLCGKEVIVPGTLNRFFLFAQHLVPSFVTDLLSRQQMKRMMLQVSAPSR